MINEEYIQELHDQLYKSLTIYEWDFSGFAGRNAPLIRWIVAVIIAGIIPVSFFIASDVSVLSLGFCFLCIIFCLVMFTIRYLLWPDRHYHYHLTHVGIHYQEQVVVPETAYTVVRGIAWVGILVCLVALVIVGPLAFVGVGGFALLSFGMINFNHKVDKLEIIFTKQLTLFDLTSDTVVDINTETTLEPEFIGRVFFRTFQDKNDFIDIIKKNHNNVNHIKIKKLNDQFKHPIYNGNLSGE
ncbi:hypothetical protein [Vibrio sp. H11]|uniref:hypothetical protein n=1 Tax=Vibrio sp. H11 TaxID=2565928 RepID=UPI0010A5C88E|nr:hypothetical protein [Vibrio sp. H11]